MKFTYKSKGSADDWTTDAIEAEDQSDALQKLDTIYGIARDTAGTQTNADMIQVEII